jgi:hypothetical protein
VFKAGYKPIVRHAAALILLTSILVSAGSPATAAPDVDGQWSEVLDWPIIPIHIALTPDGRLMSYGSTETGKQGGDVSFDIWNPVLGTGPLSHTITPSGTRTDLFCSVQVIDPLRDLIITAGGDIPGSEIQAGTSEVTTYSTSTGHQAETPMEFARWYPTANTLPNGDILVEGGSSDGVAGNGILTPERYTPGEGWTTLSGISSEYAYGNDKNRWWYPRSWVAPNGEIFGVSGPAMYYLDPEGEGDLTAAGSFNGSNWGATSTAVMYRPGLILQAGGGYQKNGGGQPASKAVSLININSGSPVVSSASSMSFGRHWATSTVLPDGDVLVTGGASGNNTLDGVAFQPEIWDPDTDTWSTLEAETFARLYHSTAILLPDATVFVGGGGAPGPQNNLNGQIFSPPYLFDGDDLAPRPTIIDAPDEIAYGESFGLQVSADVAKATLIRAGSVTHSFNNGQRFIELDLTGSGSNRTAVAPANGNLAPPGTYLLFVLDSTGTPSVAALVDIDPADVGAPPSGPAELPTQPTPVQVSGEGLSQQVGWQASVSELPVTYTVSSRVIGETTWTSEGQTSSTSRTVGGLTEGRYQFRVQAKTSAGSSGYGYSTIIGVSAGLVRPMPLDGQVSRLYSAYFLRDPDQGGLDFWLGQRASGQTLNEMASSFGQSPEFVNTYGDLDDEAFVELVYENVTNRAPDDTGRSFWIGYLADENSRASMMVGFSESAEYISLMGTTPPTSSLEGKVYRLYLAALHREPDTGGLGYWVGQLQGGVSLAVIADGLVGSPEFAAQYEALDDEGFVELVYQNVLGRQPDDAGYAFWLSRLGAGTSRGDMMIGFSESPEYIAVTGTLP